MLNKLILLGLTLITIGTILYSIVKGSYNTLGKRISQQLKILQQQSKENDRHE